MEGTKERFAIEVLDKIIENAETSVRVTAIINDAYDFEETTNQKRVRRVLEELQTLKQEYDTLELKEIQQRFKQIIRENHYVKPKIRGKGFDSWWRKVFRRISCTGRTRQGRKD